MGPLYAPPLIAAAVLAAAAGPLMLTRRRLAPIAALVVVATVFLIGTAAIGHEAVGYRLAHPDQPAGFIADLLQLAGEATTLIATTAHLLPDRR